MAKPTTPPELRPVLPADADINQADYQAKLRPEREFEVPENFWPVTKMRYRLAKQSGEAPLIFIIAGTGAHYASGTPEYLKKLFYGAGYHVVQLSSPTSYDFMTSASRFATPGISRDDADDLYRAMQAVRAQHPRLKVSEYHLTGYSLGALDAAFVSKLDETRRSFNFKKVLLLNPPVNLYTSITNLDKLVQTEVKGINNTTTFYELVLNKLTRYFQQKGYIDLNDALLYDFQQSKQHLTNEQMAMLIGTSFRFSAADIARLNAASAETGPAKAPRRASHSSVAGVLAGSGSAGCGRAAKEKVELTIDYIPSQLMLQELAGEPAWMADLNKVSEGQSHTLGAYYRPWK